ncbi:MAG TPA: hypothetical protein PKH07_19975, partial [bacterium]|nr:hypothetical protein [bacterium]
GAYANNARSALAPAADGTAITVNFMNSDAEGMSNTSYTDYYVDYYQDGAYVCLANATRFSRLDNATSNTTWVAATQFSGTIGYKEDTATDYTANQAALIVRLVGANGLPYPAGSRVDNIVVDDGSPVEDWYLY